MIVYDRLTESVCVCVCVLLAGCEIYRGRHIAVTSQHVFSHHLPHHARLLAP